MTVVNALFITQNERSSANWSISHRVGLSYPIETYNGNFTNNS